MKILKMLKILKLLNRVYLAVFLRLSVFFLEPDYACVLV